MQTMPDIAEKSCQGDQTPWETTPTTIGNAAYEGYWAASVAVGIVVDDDRIAGNPINKVDPTGQVAFLIPLIIAGGILLYSCNTANAPGVGDPTVPAGNRGDLDVLAFAASIPVGGFAFKITGNVLGKVGVPLLGRILGGSVAAGTSVTTSTDLIETGKIQPNFTTRAALNSTMFAGLGLLFGGPGFTSMGPKNYTIRLKDAGGSIMVEGESCSGSFTRSSFAGEGNFSPLRGGTVARPGPSVLPTVQEFQVTAQQYRQFFRYLEQAKGTSYLKYGPTPIGGLPPGLNNCVSPISQGLNDIGAFNKGLLNGPYGPTSLNWSPTPRPPYELPASLGAAAGANISVTVERER